MKLHTVVASSILAVAGFSAVGTAVAQVVIGPPPPPRYEVVPGPRAGYVWDGGHWRWMHGRYVWIGGHWRPVRVGHRWYAGHLDRRGRWQEGYWR